MQKRSSVRVLFTIFTIVAMCFVGAIAYAQDDTIVDDIDMAVSYYGQITTLSNVHDLASGELYCALNITKEVVDRGYFDGRIDTLLCYNSNSEMINQSDANGELIASETAEEASKSLVSSEEEFTASGQFNSLYQPSCANLNRGTGFLYTFYNTNWSDVCSQRTTSTSYNGQYVRSVYLVGSCSRIAIVQNTLPNQTTTLVDYSAAVVYFYAVARINWSPKSNPC